MDRDNITDNVKTFTSREFGSLRTATIDNEVWFCLIDASRMLDLIKFKKVKASLDRTGVKEVEVPIARKPQVLTFVNRENLYKIAVDILKAKATPFIDWIETEILPLSILSEVHSGEDVSTSNANKTGSDTKILLQACKSLIEEQKKVKNLTDKIVKQQIIIGEQEKIIEELQAKLAYHTKFTIVCQEPMPISAIARQYGWTGSRLNKYLHNKNVIYKENHKWRLTQEYSGKGLAKEYGGYFDNEGRAPTNIRWTQEGKDLIRDLLKADGILPKAEAERVNTGGQKGWII